MSKKTTVTLFYFASVLFYIVAFFRIFNSDFLSSAIYVSLGSVFLCFGASEKNKVSMEGFIDKVKEYAKDTPYIDCVIIVGSHARGTNKRDSDLDVVIITSNKMGMIENQEFTREFGVVHRQQTEYYGACTSIRVWYKGGKEVEFGIVEPSWISTPLDTGTYQVLSGGYKVILDKNRYFDNLKL